MAQNALLLIVSGALGCGPSSVQLSDGVSGFGSSGCFGVTPSTLGTPITRTIDYARSSSANFCSVATSDGAGNVAGQLAGPGPNPWTIWSPDGVVKGHFNGTDVVPQANGFEGIFFSGSGSDPNEQALYAWMPSGVPTAKTNVGTTSGVNSVSSFPAAMGGAVVVAIACDTQAPPGTGIVVSRSDASGKLISSVRFSSPGCVQAASAIADPLDRTLVLVGTGGAGAFGFGSGMVIARWLDMNGAPMTEWFDGGVALGELRPTIGGGAVLRSGGHWIAAFASGMRGTAAVPPFLADADDLSIVGGGKAYALVPVAPGSGVIQLYSGQGERCGSVQLPGGTQLRVGADGTVISMAGSDGCTVTWWPHLLR